MKIGHLVASVVFSGNILYPFHEKTDEVPKASETEIFIENVMVNENGTLATYLKDTDIADRDNVKGREALSESLGLWMESALMKGDRVQFEKGYQLLKKFYLEKDGFVSWKLTDKGVKKVSSNALVEDLRFLKVLLAAKEGWNDERYGETAIQISDYIMSFNRNEGFLTDYYSKENDDFSEILTLSYIEPDALQRLKQHGLIDLDIYTNMLDVLKNAPLEGAFYPTAYDVGKVSYLYHSEINMIDQSLIALYRTKTGGSSKGFMEFILKEMEQNGAVLGKYERSTEKPSVDYESPAVYGWLVFYSIELNDMELAKQFYDKMLSLKSTDPKFAGGYSVYEDNTHIFDNLVPLMAERAMKRLNAIDIIQ